MQYFSRISAENVGSQPYFLLIAIIRLSRISAGISFQLSGILRKFGLWVYSASFNRSTVFGD